MAATFRGVVTASRPGFGLAPTRGLGTERLIAAELANGSMNFFSATTSKKGDLHRSTEFNGNFQWDPGV
ncbi:MAG: hypothetical protein WCA20_09105 [Candidatus Sulfotelmatobacter sp.]